MMKQVVVLCHNLRSTHNVGSILRSCDGFGAAKVYFTGYTPFPYENTDTSRLPHIAQKLDRQISKTALGAEKTVSWEHHESIAAVVEKLRSEGYMIAAIEQSPKAIMLASFTAPDKIAIIMGREVEGIETEVLNQCDVILEIPMVGAKESFNVSVAAAIVLYQLSL